MILLSNLCAVLCYVSIAWLISAILRRADIIDAFWGPGFVLIAALTFANAAETENLKGWVLLIATTIWGLRLGLHLLIRWRGEAREDRRYAAMRSAGGPKWWLQSLVTVFLLQGGIMWVVALPLQFGLSSTQAGPAFVIWNGFVIWLIGFVFEAVGDRQLSAFRLNADNADKVLNTGLWRYTRHPNYFGDFLVWWGLFAMAVSCGAPIWTVVSPIIMSLFLMKFSGVGILERNITSRRPGYAEYVRTTNTFFPWFPARSVQPEV